MLVVLDPEGSKRWSKFRCKDPRNSTEPLDLFYAHVSGMDAFARALITADNVLQKSSYKKFREERYASFDNGRGKSSNKAGCRCQT
jgi:xylose isomerase